MTNKELNREQLENVSGGTVNEYDEIFRAVFKKMGGSDGVIADLGTHCPFTNVQVSDSVYLYLRDKYGIRADFSLGFLGTGLGSDPNTYKEVGTNRILTHEEVLRRIGG